jgi:hypothetical protein
MEKSKLTEELTKEDETGEEQSQEHAHNSITSRRLFSSNLSWQAKQSLPQTTVTFMATA